MRISSQSLAQSSFMSYLCGAKKGRDGLCHQRKENSDWASNPARVCQESNAQACPPAVLGWSATIKADTVQLTYPKKVLNNKGIYLSWWNFWAMIIMAITSVGYAIYAAFNRCLWDELWERLWFPLLVLLFFVCSIGLMVWLNLREYRIPKY